MKKGYLLLIAVFSLLFIPMLCFTSCKKETSQLHNGYYKAEAAEFDSHGWKEYITIYVRDNRIVTVEYNAKNPSGFIKSWDMSYMKAMNAKNGTYPNEYTRYYAAQLLSGQGGGRIDALSGATHSYHVFLLLADSVVTQSKTGDTAVVLVNIPEESE